jgi:hypothetical protein
VRQGVSKFKFVVWHDRVKLWVVKAPGCAMTSVDADGRRYATQQALRRVVWQTMLERKRERERESPGERDRERERVKRGRRGGM